jgi:hypothetical protein
MTAVMTLAFFGCLRASEFCVSEGSSSIVAVICVGMM